MNEFGLEFHHLGLAVPKPETALRFVRGMGYRTGEPIFDPLQNVNLIMCEHPAAPDIEIIYRARDAGPLEPLLAKHTHGLVYHCCYVTQDVDKSLALLESAGVRSKCLLPSKPAVLFGGVHVSFHQVPGFGLIEIIEGTPRSPQR